MLGIEAFLYEQLLELRPAQLADLVKTLLRIQRIQVEASTGCLYWVDPVSVFGAHLLHEKVHEPQLTHLLQLLLRPGDSFLDVGGNEGYFSILAAVLVQDGPVYWVEPQPKLKAVVEENIRLNNARTVCLQQVALGDRVDRVTLHLRPSTNTGAASLFRHWKIGSATQVVPMTTLDGLCSGLTKRVRLMKIDAEGAENLILAGGRHALDNHLFDFVALDFHPLICGTEACKITHGSMKSHGYTLTKVKGVYIYHLPGLEGALAPLGDLQIDCAWNA